MLGQNLRKKFSTTQKECHNIKIITNPIFDFFQLSRLIMKRSFLLAASCFFAVAALTQALVTTPVMGFLTLNLNQGTNFMGFALLPAMELQGVANISAEDRTRIFLQGSPQVTLTDNQFNSGAMATHVLEIASGQAGVGFTSIVIDTLATGNEIILEEEVPEEVGDGVTVKIWKLWTLADVFGAANSAGLTGAAVPENADLIQIPNGTDFDQYFYSTGGQGYTQGWRQVGDFTTNQASVPLDFSGGVALFARSAKSVVIVGQVKPGKTQITLQPGNNFVANLCPVNSSGDTPSQEGRELANSGLQEGLTPGINSNKADLVLFWNSTKKGYDQYYYSSGGPLGTGWRKVGAGNADQSEVSLPDGAYIIFRRAESSVDIQLNQGDF